MRKSVQDRKVSNEKNNGTYLLSIEIAGKSETSLVSGPVVHMAEEYKYK